jgi:hypothetical protein
MAFKSKLKLVRGPDGNPVYSCGGKASRFDPGVADPSPSFYPSGGRVAMYKGQRDPRNDPEFAGAVRELRSRGKHAGVRTGQQCMIEN